MGLPARRKSHFPSAIAIVLWSLVVVAAAWAIATGQLNWPGYLALLYVGGQLAAGLRTPSP